MAVRILGVDPGTVVFGFACLEVQPARRAPVGRRLGVRASNVQSLTAPGAVTLLEAGAKRLGRGRPIADRLGLLAREIGELIDRLKPTELALEEAFAGKSVQSALRIGEARGAVLAAASLREVPVHQFSPARIKRSVAGHGGASKEAVAAMACRALGITSIDGPPDVGDAIAVALCRHESR